MVTETITRCEHDVVASITTRPHDGDVDAYLDAVPNERRRADARALRVLMEHVTGAPATMWGPSMVGFGSRAYTNTSGPNDWFVVGLSARQGRADDLRSSQRLRRPRPAARPAGTALDRQGLPVRHAPRRHRSTGPDPADREGMVRPIRHLTTRHRDTGRLMASATAVGLGGLGLLHVAAGAGVDFPYSTSSSLARCRDRTRRRAVTPGVLRGRGRAVQRGRARRRSGHGEGRRGASWFRGGGNGARAPCAAFGFAGRTDRLVPGSESAQFRRLDRRVFVPLCLALAGGATCATLR